MTGGGAGRRGGGGGGGRAVGLEGEGVGGLPCVLETVGERVHVIGAEVEGTEEGDGPVGGRVGLPEDAEGAWGVVVGVRHGACGTPFAWVGVWGGRLAGSVDEGPEEGDLALGVLVEVVGDGGAEFAVDGAGAVEAGLSEGVEDVRPVDHAVSGERPDGLGAAVSVAFVAGDGDVLEGDEGEPGLDHADGGGGVFALDEEVGGVEVDAEAVGVESVEEVGEAGAVEAEVLARVGVVADADVVSSCEGFPGGEGSPGAVEGLLQVKGLRAAGYQCRQLCILSRSA